MNIDKRERILIVVAIVIILIIVLAIVFWLKPSLVSQNNQSSGSAQNQSSNYTRQPISQPVAVPSVGQSSGDVAVPIATAYEAPGSNQSQARAFNISISGNQFSPAKISVYNGDVVNIVFTATDKNYDVYQPDYGWLATIKQGGKASVVFTANSAGRFTFYCPSCGGPSKGPVGYVYVNSIK